MWTLIKWGGLILTGIVLGATVQEWRWDAKYSGYQRDILKEKNEAVTKARAEERARANQVQEALNAAIKREQALRSNAAALRNANSGLLLDLTGLQRRLSEEPVEAVRIRAATLATVFGYCTTAYSELAERCDRHVSDKQTLIEAWPK
jgi:hypothetical protein